MSRIKGNRHPWPRPPSKPDGMLLPMGVSARREKPTLEGRFTGSKFSVRVPGGLLVFRYCTGLNLKQALGLAERVKDTPADALRHIARLALDTDQQLFFSFEPFKAKAA